MNRAGIRKVATTRDLRRVKKSLLDWDLRKIREDFPILSQQVNGVDLVYLDNAATTQKPLSVIETMNQYYLTENANVHRAVHALSERATEHYEHSRKRVKQFIRAKSEKEIIFVRGTTEAVNLVASSLSRCHFKAGDEVIVTAIEHHANIVPWQLMGLKLRVIPMNHKGELLLDEYPKLFNKKTKMVALNHVSNALGTINPVKEMIKIAHQHDVPVFLDGAQSIVHMPVDVQDLDCDFFAFSGHKLYGPTGVGVLYGKEEWLERMPPYQGGGDMIRSVSFEHTEFNDLPFKFEAGTPNIAGVVGLGAAIDYIDSIGMDKIMSYEQELLAYATQALSEIKGLTIVGQAEHKAAVISFVLDNVHPHDIASIVDHNGIAIRAGHHCAMPIMQFFDIPATARASFGFYNTMTEIDLLVSALLTVQELFTL